MIDNQIELLKEDIECVHMFLDDRNIPRKDSSGNIYSMVGRILLLVDNTKNEPVGIEK